MKVVSDINSPMKEPPYAISLLRQFLTLSNFLMLNPFWGNISDYFLFPWEAVRLALNGAEKTYPRDILPDSWNQNNGLLKMPKEPNLRKQWTYYTTWHRGIMAADGVKVAH